MQETYTHIIDKENIQKAYLSIVGKFDSTSKSSSYIGLDGVILNDYNYTSLELIDLIQHEMISFTTTLPASSFSIPKKSNGKRNIYIYAIKERVKAEAIYRVLEPLLNPFISPYVYSYRISHPAYYAARSIVRRYKRFYGKNYVLTADLSDYTDSMDHDLLIQKLVKHGIDDKTLKLIELFIKAPVVDQGKIIFPQKGLMTGTPLSGLLANLFMKDFDSWAGKYVNLYRRVGDDMIAFDTHSEKISQVFEKLKETIYLNKLVLNEKKVSRIPDSQTFDFLGYRFSQGMISFDPRSINRTLLKWRVDLYRYPGQHMYRKFKHFRYIFFRRATTIDHQFEQIIRQKNLVDNQKQLKLFSDKFYNLLVKYFYGSVSPKNRRKFLELCQREYTIKSLFAHYIDSHFPKKYAKK